MAIGVGQEGLAYESKIKKIVRDAAKNIPALTLIHGRSTGGYDNTGADLLLKINKTQVPIELKKDKHAQMGGTSVYYDLQSKKIDFKTQAASILDADTRDLVQAAVGNMHPEIEEFLEFLRTYPPSYNTKVKGFPLVCTKEAWEMAKNKGLLKAINRNIDYNTKFVCELYNRKNVNYVQIGGAGLFYMNKNPLSLPVPPLQGELKVEVRAAPSGVVLREGGLPCIKSTLRVQGRCNFKGKSDYDLENPYHVAILFGK